VQAKFVPMNAGNSALEQVAVNESALPRTVAAKATPLNVVR
jgi:hypothetical protein